MQKTDYRTHVCLVSDQAIPNITPVLDKRYAPERVVLIVSGKKMQVKAGGLKNVFVRHDIKVIVEHLRSEDDFEIIRQDFKRIAQTYPDSVLNATGGKKIMTLAAYEAFLGENLPVFYVEMDNTLRWLTPISCVDPLQHSVSVTDILEAYLYKVTSMEQGATQVQNELAAIFFSGQNYLSFVLTNFEFIGKESKKTIRRKDNLPFDEKDIAALRLIAQHDKQHDMISFQNGKWFGSAAGAKFLSGEWLEIHVYNMIANIADKYGIKDCCRALKIHSASDPTIENEIDVAFVHDNHLYLIECKALRKSVKNKSMVDFIYTLESIKKHGGLATRAALLTWGSEPGPTDRSRAEANRIRVFSGETITRMDSGLAQWIGAA